MPGVVSIEAADVERVANRRRLYVVQRRNLYLFLSEEEMEGWMEDWGPLRIRWFEAKIGSRKVGVASWEVYDIHQYFANWKRYVILDLYTMEVEYKYRSQRIGSRLFVESLRKTVEELNHSRFTVGALQIETDSARGFYEKVLTSLGYSWNLETREMVPGHPISVFWVPLLMQG